MFETRAFEFLKLTSDLIPPVPPSPRQPPQAVSLSTALFVADELHRVPVNRALSLPCTNHEEIISLPRTMPPPACSKHNRLRGYRLDNGNLDGWRCIRVLCYCYGRMVGFYVSR